MSKPQTKPVLHKETDQQVKKPTAMAYLLSSFLCTIYGI